ncbi:A-kinase anchor protein 1, mitochondrial [Bulinus truncatus]|nr:A-kinase anchor protein 1, mitochondrial [Bulinus truncatus]
MRDYRISFALAIPVSIALIGVLWILKKKSASNVKTKVTKNKLKGTNAESSVKKCAGQEQHIDNESVTVTQRKIPETLARDRGSADLSQPESDKNDSADISKKTVYCDASENLKASNLCPISHGVKPVIAMKNTYIDNSDFAVNKHSDSKIEGKMSQLINDDVTFTEILGNSIMEEKQPCLNYCEEFENINNHEIIDSLDVCQRQSFGTGTSIVSLDDEKNHSVACLTSSETIQVDQLVLSALEDGLTEAKTQLAKQPIHNTDVLKIHCQQVDLSSEAGLESKDAAYKDLSAAIETDNNLIQNMVSCCDNLELTSVNSCSNSDKSEVKSSDQSSLQICPTILNSSVTLVEKEDISVDKQNLIKNSVTLNDVMLAVDGAPCNNYSVTSTTEHFSSSLSFESFSADLCTNYNISWSSETAVDEPSSVNLETPGLNSTVIELLTDNEIFTQEVVSPDLSVNISGVLDPKIGTLANHVSTSDSNKQASPAKSNSPSCDNNSEGSNDSGRGGSEHDVTGHTGDAFVHFDFNIPSELCGRFIGKQGKNINFLKNKTGANVSLVNNPYTADYQICRVVGTQIEIDDALAMIRRKFPLNEYPLLTMLPISLNPLPTQIEHPLIVPEVMQLSLPEGVSVEVFVSAIVDAGHVFVQQPTHRSFMSLEKLTYFLNSVYGQDPNVPCVPTPVEYGIICVCENEGCWYRAMIMSAENENGETQVKFVDYGGYAVMPVSSLKQIRTDFMSLPFQAVECFMANITPNQGEAFFSEESTMALSTMTEYKLLQCQVVARSENGIPYIHLYQVNPETNSAVMINRALVNSQLVRWIEIL